MEGISIFNSIAFVGEVNPIDVINIQAAIRKGQGRPFEYQEKKFDDLKTAMVSLKPLVMNPTRRYLFCRGRNKKYSLYSNFLFGAAADLTRTAGPRLKVDTMDAFWNDYQFARRYDATIPKNTRYHFNLNVALREHVQRERTIGCTINGKGNLFYSWDGEMFSFEKSEDYTHLQDGVPPGMHILKEFCGIFGWPSPLSEQYPEFIIDCFIYEFPPDPQYPERIVSEELQQQVLRWPW
ncbi:hypothetical protein LLG95_09615 [bacterium]|nr:hypothetical protein [bacterium]